MVNRLPNAISLFHCVVTVWITAWISDCHADDIAKFSFETSKDVSVIIYEGEKTEITCISKASKSSNSSTLQERNTINWIFPTDVKVVSTTNLNPAQKGPWVELTPLKMLIFHNPDQSLPAQYTCYDDVNRSTVWVKVIKKPNVDNKDRIAPGLIGVAAVVAALLVGCCIGKYLIRRSRKTYSKTNVDEMFNFEMNIPSIEIINEHGEKVHQTVYDFM